MNSKLHYKRPILANDLMAGTGATAAAAEDLADIFRFGRPLNEIGVALTTKQPTGHCLPEKA